MIGTTLSHYRITEKLGQGGMGEVYRAEDTNLSRQVAIKVLPDEFAHDAERLARFEREAKLLASLNHPNIASIYGLEQADGKPFLVLELVEGQTLAERLKKGRIPLDETLDICRQIAEGLEAAHEKGVIHRDLKPGNVMITADDNVKILDFGLAKALAGESQAADATHSPTITEAMTRPGVILGTAAYMSPEQAKGKPVDKRSDIWAFGCILYECLTGKAPFKGETVTETVAKILEGTPDWKLIPPTTTWNLKQLLYRCLQKDPRERLHDIADARLEVTRALSHATIPEETPRPMERSRIFGTILITFIIAVTATSVVTWHLRPIPEQASVRSTIELPPGTQLTREQVGPAYTEIALSPNGKFLVFSASLGGSPEKAMLYLRPLGKFEATPVSGIEGARAPFFSADGEWVGFWHQGKLKKWPIAGGIPAVVCECPKIPMGAAWSPSGRIVIGTDREGLQQIEPGQGKLERLTTPKRTEESSHVLPWFLPGEESLLFTVKAHPWGTQSHIEALSLESGRRTVLISDGADPRFVPTGHLIYMSQGTLLAVPFDSRKMAIQGQAVPVIQGVAQALNALHSDHNSGAGQFVFSPAGTLAYASGGIFLDLETRPTWVDQNGRTELLTHLDKKWIVSVRLSPDGRYLAYRTKGKSAEVWVHDLALGTSRRITREGEAMHLCWTPDGTRLTFAFSKSGSHNIFWKAADGSGPTEPELLVASEYDLQPSTWSADGRLLIFVEEGPNLNEDIWAYHTDSREKSPLFNAEYNEEYPAISPNGHWLAYCSDETGQLEVYVTPMSTKPAKGTLVTSGGGFAPLWAPDSRTLYYWNQDFTKLMAMDIGAAPGITVGKPRQLFSFPTESISYVRSYDISCDGSRFIIVGRAEIKPFEVPRLNLVQNWFEELKRLCPTGK